MIIRDALPRTVDLQALLNLDAAAVANRCSEALRPTPLDWHAALMPDPAARIAEDAARILEYLGLALEQRDPALFVGQIRWLDDYWRAHGLDRTYTIALLEVLEPLVRWPQPKGRARQVAVLFQQASDGLWSHSDETIAPSYPADRNGGLLQTREALLTALLHADLDAALAVIADAFTQDRKTIDIYLGILQPVMEEVGRRWQSNTITVAEEHVATALMESVMAYCHRRSGATPSHPKGLVALTGVAGELHDLGLRIVADVLEAHGWRVRCFGTNSPTPVVADALAADPPDVIGISITMAFNLKAAAILIQALRDRPGLSTCPIVVGGRAIHRGATWRHLGADDFAPDALGFLDLLDGLRLTLPRAP